MKKTVTNKPAVVALRQVDRGNTMAKADGLAPSQRTGKAGSVELVKVGLDERFAPGQRGAPAAHRRVVGTDREARQAQRPEYRGNVLGTSCLRAEARGEQDAHAPSRGQSANPCRSLLLLIVLRGRNSTVARTTESAATCVHARTRIRAHGTKSCLVNVRNM